MNFALFVVRVQTAVARHLFRVSCFMLLVLMSDAASCGRGVHATTLLGGALRWEFIKENKKVRKKERKTIKKKIIFFLFFLAHLVAFLVESVFPFFFSYFLVFFYKFSPLRVMLVSELVSQCVSEQGKR